MAIPIVLEQLASGVIPANPKSAFGKIGSQIRQLWLEYPQQEHRDFAIIMAARTGEKMTATFSVGLMTFKAEDGDWDLRDEPIPTTSASLMIGGSGATEIRAAERLWQASAHANTSRAVFSAFCDSVRNGGDPQTGGAPQLVGLRRIGDGMNFGVVYEGRRYLSGSLVGRAGAATSTTPWFNELFERYDGERKVKLAEAQRHVRR